MKVQIIDAICGSGKTTWMFKYIEQNKEKKWIFVSPYLDEVGDGRTKGRIQEALPALKFKSPTVSPSKKASFLRLLENENNIAITHRLFMDFTPEVAQAIAEKGYELVIDETIDLVSFYDGINGDDVRTLIKAQMILVEDKGKLSWNNKDWKDYKGRDSDIKNLCDLGCLYLYGEDVLIQRIPPTCLQACNSCTVLTYMFEGSLMQAWMKLNNIEYEYFYPEGLLPEKKIKEKVKENLFIIKPSKVILDLQEERGEFKDSTFSLNWYGKTSVCTFNDIKKSIEKTLKTYMHKGDTFWTTFKDYKDVLKGKGYSRRKKVPWLKELRDPFVPKNMRASNEYKDCVNCIYTVNVYPNGSIKSHLASFGVELDEDKVALCELIQFIFRGSIRQYEEMSLLILSNRMRNLLKDWLNA
jgi:hypothetical protein